MILQLLLEIIVCVPMNNVYRAVGGVGDVNVCLYSNRTGTSASAAAFTLL